MKTFTEEEVRDALARRLSEAKFGEGVRKWAKQFGPSVGANLDKAINGKIKIGGQIAQAAGFRRVVIETYIRSDVAYTPPEGWREVSGD